MSERESTRRLPVNALLSASTWFLPSALSFIATPILIKNLGVDAYGLYALVLGFVGYSFSFGIGKAAAKFVAEYRAAGRHDLAAQAISATLWLTILVGASGTVIIYLFAGPFVDDVLQVPPSMRSDGRSSLLIAAGIIAVTMVSQVWSFALQGINRFDIFASITAFGSILLNSGSIALAWYGYDVPAILLWNLVSATLLAVLFILASNRQGLHFDLRPNVGPPIRKAVWTYGGAIALSQIFGNLLLLFERSWITRVFGIESLTYYVVPMTLALFLHALVGSIVFVLFPLINSSLFDVRRVADVYRGATKFILAFTVFALLSSVFLGEQLLRAWVGTEIAARSASLLVIHVATFGLLATATVAWHVVESFGRARLTVIFSLAWLLVSAALMLILGGHSGLEGVGVSRLAGCLGVVALAVYVETKILGGFSFRYWTVALVRLLPAAALGATAQWFATIIAKGPAAVVAGGIAGAIIFGGLVLSLGYFNARELDWMRQSVRRSQT